MYSENTEKICAYCVFKTDAKGLREHVYCTKRKEYRPLRGTVCSDYDYDIRKRPVRRRKSELTKREYDFEI